VSPRLAVTVLAALSLAACGGDDYQDIRQWMTEASKDLRGTVPSLPEIRAFPIISYNATDMVEPFAPAKIAPEKRQGGGLTPDFDRPKEHLESFPLETLRMVGAIRKEAVMYALIQASGMVYQVRPGNYVGQNFGMVTSVSDTEVKITELVQDPSGQTTEWVERPASLLLQDVAEPR
jgi:type IV pilus assembly protein PilP